LRGPETWLVPYVPQLHREAGLRPHPATFGASGRPPPSAASCCVGRTSASSDVRRRRFRHRFDVIPPSTHRRHLRPHEEDLAIATPPATNEPRINDRIRAREVRLVGHDGQQIGIKPLPEALAIARELDLDLVEVAAQANPPVCRIMDFGKYKYEAAQKAKESRRKTTNVVIKEMKYRPKISGGDFDTKTRKVKGFLLEGHKVKVTLTFRGREVYHPDLGKKILDQVEDAVKDVGRVEIFPRIDGRNMTMVLSPDKRAQAAAEKAAAAAAEEAEAGGAPLEAIESLATAEAPAAPDEAPEAAPDVDDTDTDIETDTDTTETDGDSEG
jgi:translation initiation factor IF-3